MPSLAQPVSPACIQKINDPNRDFLGASQLKQFEDDVKSSSARFKVIMNEVPIQQFYALPYDRWEGYEAERQKVLHFLQDNVKNAIFLTTDVHATMVNDARFKTLEQGGPVNSGIIDFTTGPVATMSFAKEIDSTTGNPNAGSAVDNAFFEPQPANGGLGMQCSVLDKFSYGEVTVTKTKLVVEPKGIDGRRLTDEDGNPCAKVTLR